nr:hypothetical protein [uncultured Sphingomonas sp.]
MGKADSRASFHEARRFRRNNLVKSVFRAGDFTFFQNVAAYFPERWVIQSIISSSVDRGFYGGRCRPAILLGVFLGSAALCGPALAGEVISYSYDALGRLVPCFERIFTYVTPHLA